MKNKYKDLIEQTFEFPNEEFNVLENELEWYDVPLMDIIKQYGTPLRIAYLPKIGMNIQKARRMFNVAMAKVDYKGDYNYCYCTKSSHFSFVMEEVLKNGVHLETSSAFDINIMESLYEQELLKADTYVICNGFKRPQYVENIQNLMRTGFSNVIPILDNKFELDLLLKDFDLKFNVGIRIAAEEEPKFDFYTSRLGIRYKDIIPYYLKNIANNPQVKLKMLHFFINTGVKDTSYYWNELNKAVNLYCELKKKCPELDYWWGLPYSNSPRHELRL
jgi:arginine decarboxylase